MQIEFANKKAALIEENLNHLRSLQLNDKVNNQANLMNNQANLMNNQTNLTNNNRN